MNVVTTLLGLLQTIVPTLTGSGTMGTVVSTLTQLVPILIDGYKDALPSVRNIIESLRGNDDVTDEQWLALDAIEVLIDAEFEKAAKAAEEEDKT